MSYYLGERWHYVDVLKTNSTFFILYIYSIIRLSSYLLRLHYLVTMAMVAVIKKIVKRSRHKLYPYSAEKNGR